MNEILTQTKIKIFEEILKRLEESKRSHIYAGLCTHIEKVCDDLDYDFRVTVGVTDFFRNLKPTIRSKFFWKLSYMRLSSVNGYWWSWGSEGNNQRIKFVKQILKSLKTN